MRNGLVLLVIGGALLLAACGGGGATGPTAAPAAEAPTTAPGSPADGGSGTGSEPSAQPPGAAPATDAPAPGGGTATGDVCGLVTEDELEGILGVASVSTRVMAGPPDTCDIQTGDGAPLAATVLTDIGPQAASAVYDAFASDPASTDIPGIGERAAYNPTQAVLVFLKNGVVVTVAVFDDDTRDEAARLEVMKQIAATAAGRL